MLRRLRRPAAALIPVLLLLPVLAACGSSAKNDSPSKSQGGLDAVSFSGDVGKSLTAKWHKKVAEAKSTKVTTLVKGTGAKIASDDTVSAYLWVGNGTTKKEAFSDYKNGAPESIPASGQLGPVLSKLLEGATYGSRVAAVTTPKDLLGSASGSSQLGIGANDNLVVVADLVKKAAVSPEPSDDKAHDVAPSKLPKVVEKSGKPTGLDFKGIDEPSLTTPVQRAILKKGTGARVKASDTLTIDYLGMTYQAKSPFDASYARTPYVQALGNLVKGWQIGLTGVKVGSRVLLQMPPAFGYGAQGSGEKIPGNATLWFVIDVEKAKAK